MIDSQDYDQGSQVLPFSTEKGPKQNLPAVAIRQARLPTEFPMSTVGL